MLLGPRATEQEVARLRTAYGLDQPIYVQYGVWLGHVLQGDLGDSIQLHRPVVAEVTERFRGTLVLALAAMAVAFSGGIGLGLLAAVNANTLLDRAAMSLLPIGISRPPFWVGLILIIAFSLLLRWLPATGMISATGAGGPGDVLVQLILPTMSLAVVPLAVIALLNALIAIAVVNISFYARGVRAATLVVAAVPGVGPCSPWCGA